MQRPYTLHSLQKRIKAIFLILVLMFCSCSVRLFIVQIINGKELQQRATDQWTRDLTLTAPRGSFFDATNDSLAVSYTTYNIYSRGREIKDVLYTSKKLSNLLNVKEEVLNKKLANKNISEVLLKMKVEPEIAEKVYAEKLPGIYMSENVGRYYIYGDLFTQLLGFSSIDNKGQAGLEAYFDKYLKGKDGYSYVQSDLQGKEIGNSIRYYVNGVSGNNLYLTANSKIQLLLEKSLKQAYIEQKAKSVTGIVMNCESGEILGISSKPSFDLNNIPREDMETLFSNMKMKALTDTYEPGSTFKILTLAAALEAGVTNLNDHFYCPGYRIVDGQRIKCWRSIGHGNQTLMEAFSNSCNCCFMDLAQRLGVDRFYEYMTKFGLGQKTGISMKGESSGILMPQKLVKKVDLARMGFGHAIAVTPLQLLSIVAGIVNGGVWRTPSVVKEIKSIKGKVVYKPEIKSKRIVSKETSSLINKFLQKAENKEKDFTFVEGYNVGGKTGTAQKYNEFGQIDRGKYISSFIGTYPANQPKYLFMILVDEASAGAYYGSVVAAPYGKVFYKSFFDFFNIPKDDNSITVEKIIMPNVEGLSLANAVSEIRKLGLNYDIDGEGNKIIKQLPPAGVKINKGDTIILIT